MNNDLLKEAVTLNVQQALAEDIQAGDITAELIPANTIITARVITREPTILCGRPWVTETFQELDNRLNSKTKIGWLADEGAQLQANATLFEISGQARTLLTGERTALNFLQTLCATATQAKRYADKTSGLLITVLDTRKTLPGLRIAQKYAVEVGGCNNHRLGLWDAFLIKENHIAACGSITQAIKKARELHPQKPVQVEVETHKELNEALNSKAEIIMLDNFSLEETLKILDTPAPNSIFEISGNIDLETFQPLPSKQPYRISVGALTKHIRAIDLSFRVVS